MAPWPITTFLPTWTGEPLSQWSTAASWMLVRAPMTISAPSARMTALYHTFTSSAKVALPTMVAFSATRTVGCRLGLWPSYSLMSIVKLLLCAKILPLLYAITDTNARHLWNGCCVKSNRSGENPRSGAIPQAAIGYPAGRTPSVGRWDAPPAGGTR